MKRDDIAVVHTSVGIATLIQVPDRPTSVVLGDTSAFKVEYLENAITIKPLSGSAKSNLYIYTEARRFNVSLVTTSQAGSDYIVYLEPEIRTPEHPKEVWRDFHADKSAGKLEIKIRRLGTVNDCLLVDFTVFAKADANFLPEWIWLTQGGKTVPVQSLSLSAAKVSERTPVSGLLSVRREDVVGITPLTLEIRAPHKISIRLPQVRLWMK